MEGRLQRTVGENLRRVRSELGLSQERFGEEVGWHRTFVGAVERGERNLTLRSVERISDQLGVHPFDLLWESEGIRVTLGRGVLTLTGDGAAQPVSSEPSVRAAARRGSESSADSTPVPSSPRSPRPRRGSVSKD